MKRIAWTLVVLASLTFSKPSRAVVEVFGDDTPVWTVGPTIDSDAHQPAVAYDSTRDQYLMAWSQDEGDAGFRVRHGIAGAATGQGLLPPLVDLDSGIGQAREVACAYDAFSDLYLVVWTQDALAPGAFEIMGRFVGADNTAVGPAFQISSAGLSSSDPAFDAVDPDVASNDRGSFLVTWAMDDDQLGFGDGNFDVYSRMLSSGASAPTAPIRRITDVSAGGSLQLDALAPAIAYYPDLDQWGMVLEMDTLPSVAHQPTVNFLALNGDGSPVGVAKGRRDTESLSGTVALAKAGLPVYFKNPDIAFDRRERRFLAVWETNVAGEPRIAGRTINGDYSFGPGPLDLSHVSAAGDQVCIARDATVAYSHSTGRYLVGWSGSTASTAACPGDREILVREVERDGTPIGPAPVPISTMGDDATPPPTAVSPALVASDASHHGLFAIWSADSPERGGFEIYGQFLTMDVATSNGDAPAIRALALSAVPNPFNPSTTIHFELPSAGEARLRIYDVRGQLVRDLAHDPLPAGSHQRRWNGIDDRGRSVASGVYLVQLEHPSGVRTQKIALVE